MPNRRSIVVSAVCGALALALYASTVAPGLVAIEDTPKFQFVGRILGTAHPPGYPFYVVVSHVFGLIPLGNLAWRINMLSAVCAATTVALVGRAAMDLGISPLVASAVSLGLATGAGFWFSATIAEVYALHGTLFAAMVAALGRWQRTQRPAWFFAGIAAFSIGLGHHTSIVTVGPGVAVFAIAIAPGFSLRPRTIASILGLFALGFSQYLFVLVRTRQGAWGESPASTLPELIDVIRGARWTGYLAAPTLATLTERFPVVVARLIEEVSWPAAALAIAGVGVLAWKNRPALGLLLGSLAGVLAFCTFFSGQTEGFLQPAFVSTWLLAACGVHGIISLLQERRMRLASLVASVALTFIAVWHLRTNLDARDLSHRRFEMRYFDALVTQLPGRSGILAEDFLVDRMVLYEKFSNPAFQDRDLVAQVEATPARVEEYAGGGRQLFAFASSASRLRQSGFPFDYAKWPLEYGSLQQFLDDQPRGSVIAYAVPAMRLGTALAQDAVPAAIIGARRPVPSFANRAVIGVIGGASAVESEDARSRASAFVGRGTPVGNTTISAPADVLAEASYDEAAIRIGSRVVIRSSQPVLAVWSPRGDLVAALALTDEGRVPMPSSPVDLHRLRALPDSTPVDAAGANLTAAAVGGHVRLRTPPPSLAVDAHVQHPSRTPMVLYAARRSRTLAPQLIDAGAASDALDVRELAGDALAGALREDGFADVSQWTGMAHVYRIALPAEEGSWHLAFGGLPDSVAARWTGGGLANAAPIDLTEQLEQVDGATKRLHVARDHHRLFLGVGWSPVTSDETGPFAVTIQGDAEVLLPCGKGDCRTIAVQLWSDAGQRVDITVNGAHLDPLTVGAGWSVYRVAIPASARHVGMNSLVIGPQRPVRLADISVDHAVRSTRPSE